jgi:hypothetical protein
VVRQSNLDRQIIAAHGGMVFTLENTRPFPYPLILLYIVPIHRILTGNLER